MITSKEIIFSTEANSENTIQIPSSFKLNFAGVDSSIAASARARKRETLSRVKILLSSKIYYDRPKRWMERRRKRGGRRCGAARCYVRLVDEERESAVSIFRLRRNDSPSSVYMRSY